MGAYLAGNWPVIAYSFGGFGLASFIAYAMGAWTPAYLSRTFGWHAAQIGWTWGFVVASTGAIGAVFGGMLIDRVCRAGVKDACLVVPAVCALVAWPLVAGGYLMSSAISTIVVLGIGMTALGVIAAGSFATWQRIAPPQFRGRVSAGFVLVSALLGAGCGPVAVALVTDHVLRDEALVGRSLAITVGIAIPTMALLLFSARSFTLGGHSDRNSAPVATRRAGQNG